MHIETNYQISEMCGNHYKSLAKSRGIDKSRLSVQDCNVKYVSQNTLGGDRLKF